MQLPRPALVATYRVQLRSGFSLYDAAALVPYLGRLGISHLYLSPFFEAAPGSTHGYDVLRPDRVDDSLGGMAGLRALRAKLNEHGMGLIADIVPNHVGIAGSRQPWWHDVLRYGASSPFARYFDIDWDGLPHLPAGVLLLPILGSPLGEVLENGELHMELHEGEPVFRYGDHALPFAPCTYAGLLVDSEPHDDLPPEIAALLPALSAVERDDAENARQRFASLVRSDRSVATYVEGRIGALNGVHGDPHSFDRIEALLLRQHYRPRYWRTAGDEINYRRFFVISDLAALRIEDPEVFDACHGFILELVAEGIVDALRVDHIGGLADPPGYLRRLRDALDERACESVPIFVEKILARQESLPLGWPVNGATGYEFLAAVDGLFIDPGGEPSLTATYESFTGNVTDFATIAYHAKHAIADRWFASEIDRLVGDLDELALTDRRAHDITLRSLRRVVLALLAAFPVYRMYEPEQAREALRLAARDAAARESLDAAALDFVERCLEPPDAGEAEDSTRAGFRQRFGHLSVPIVAKGVEDTAFYRYSRLLSLNEVGADPEVFGTDAGRLHAWLAERAAHWPLAMSTSTTHDTKRSEDARARLSALSEFAAEWREEIAVWSRLASTYRGSLDGSVAPGAELEYYLYQTLVATWDEGGRDSYRDRIAAHMTKAMREAAVETSWLAVNQPYEDLALAFLDGLLADPEFLPRLARFVKRIHPVATLNSFGALALKVLAPGVPDFYQGSELPLLTLTDPDNRAPVDFAALDDALRSFGSGPPPLVDTTAKQWLTRRLLAVRAAHAELLSAGEYVPLSVSGQHRDRIFAFGRQLAEEWLAVVVPRLTRPLLAPGEPIIPPEAWADTAVGLPAGVNRWRCLLNDAEVESGTFHCRDRLARFPFAVLQGKGTAG
jgi:(1->4)-alpha-D-glucan 1-alpha-D-glucosylmutase